MGSHAAGVALAGICEGSFMTTERAPMTQKHPKMVFGK